MNWNKLLFVSFLAVWPVALLDAQTREAKMTLHVEVGTDQLYGKPVTPERLRNMQYRSYESSVKTGVFYVGVKPEFTLKNQRWGLAFGVRLMKMSSSLTPDDNYFYWLLRSEGTDTDYIRLTRLRQVSYRIGVPLEARYFMTDGKKSTARFYLKFGVVPYFNVSAFNKAKAHSEQMDKYLDTIEGQIEKLDQFMFTMYPAMGLRFDRFFLGPLNIEMQVPGILGDKDNAAFMKSSSGVNFSASLEFVMK